MLHHNWPGGTRENHGHKPGQSGSGRNDTPRSNNDYKECGPTCVAQTRSKLLPRPTALYSLHVALAFLYLVEVRDQWTQLPVAET